MEWIARLAKAKAGAAAPPDAAPVVASAPPPAPPAPPREPLPTLRLESELDEPTHPHAPAELAPPSSSVQSLPLPPPSIRPAPPPPPSVRSLPPQASMRAAAPRSTLGPSLLGAGLGLLVVAVFAWLVLR